MNAARKIIVYTHAMAGGGAERVCALLASGFADAGHDVILAVDFEASDNVAYLDPRVRVVTLGAGHVRAIIALARLLRREQADISLSALGISNLKHAAAAFLAQRLSRAVISYHGFFSSEPQILSRLSFCLTPLLTRITAATVCVSDHLRNNLVRKWRAASGRTRRIYNPVAIRKGDAARSEPPVTLAMGRLVAQKNLVGLARAFALVEPRDARLVIAGEGPERGRIEAEIARLGLASRVTLTGYVPEPWRLYGEAACLAVSSHSETFSLVVVEALAHGLPVVSTDCQGPTEILDNGRFGQIVPFDDAPAMAAAISAALRDPGDPGSRIARAAQFSVEAAVANYLELFDEIAMQAGQKRPARASARRGAALQEFR